MPALALTAASLLEKASSYIGYTEKGTNITQFWARQLPSGQGGPWCAAFVVDVFDSFGSTILKTVPAPFYTPSMESWAKKNGRWQTSYVSKPGDVIIFGNSRIATHTGILESQNPKNDWVISIEGNTSSGPGGSQTNGDGVWRRKRPRSFIRGVINMQDQFKAGAVPGLVVSEAVAKQRLDEDGEMGPNTTMALEAYLNVPINGRLDRMDTRAFQTWIGRSRTGRLSKEDIKAFQRKVGADPDGEWGPKTTLALQKFLNRRNGHRK